MIEVEQLRERVAALEAELGEAVAARRQLEDSVAEAEAALQTSYAALAAVGDPLFAATFEESRVPEVADLRRRLVRQRRRNKRLKTDLTRLRSLRRHRWPDAVGRLLGAGRLDR